MPITNIAQSVIIADDDNSVRNILRAALDRPYRAVFPAIDGIEAVGYAQSVIADVVLLDAKMARMTGLEACAQIRRLPGYAKVPIIILTAFDGASQRRNAERAGATDFMTKPFSTNGLLSRLRPVLPDLRPR
jgi:DNA-binding response OmpR family regulator